MSTALSVLFAVCGLIWKVIANFPLTSLEHHVGQILVLLGNFLASRGSTATIAGLHTTAKERNL